MVSYTSLSQELSLTNYLHDFTCTYSLIFDGLVKWREFTETQSDAWDAWDAWNAGLADVHGQFFWSVTDPEILGPICFSIPTSYPHHTQRDEQRCFNLWITSTENCQVTRSSASFWVPPEPGSFGRCHMSVWLTPLYGQSVPGASKLQKSLNPSHDRCLFSFSAAKSINLGGFLWRFRGFTVLPYSIHWLIFIFLLKHIFLGGQCLQKNTTSPRLQIPMVGLPGMTLPMVAILAMDATASPTNIKTKIHRKPGLFDGFLWFSTCLFALKNSSTSVNHIRFTSLSHVSHCFTRHRLSTSRP